MKLSLAALAPLLLLVPSAAPAGDAFFSADGKTITFLPRFKTGIIWQADVTSGKLKALPLPKELKGAPVTGIARGGEGETLLTAGTSAWVIKPDGTTKRLCDLGPAKEPSNLFVATAPGSPVVDWLFVSAADPDEPNRQIFFARKPGAKAFEKVFCRRVRSVRTGAFTADGRLFFDADGDLWEGSFAKEEIAAKMTTRDWPSGCGPAKARPAASRPSRRNSCGRTVESCSNAFCRSGTAAVLPLHGGGKGRRRLAH